MKTKKQILMLLLAMLAFGAKQEREKGTEERSCERTDCFREL